MAPTRSEPNQRPPLFVGHQLNERHALKSPHSSGEKKGRLTNSRDWPIKLAVERKSANVPNKTNCFEKKKRRISLNKHGEANKPTLPPNTYAIWLLIQLPPAANDPWQTQNSSQRNKLPRAKKTTTKRRRKESRFFFSSGGGHFRRDSVQGSPPPTGSLSFSVLSRSFSTRPTTCSAASFRMTTEGVVLERYKRTWPLSPANGKYCQVLVAFNDRTEKSLRRAYFDCVIH